MKNIIATIFILLAVFSGWGQANLPISRSSWGSSLTGWTTSGTGTYSSDVCGTSNSSSARFDDQGDYIIVNYSGSASTISFCIKGNPSSGTSITGIFLLQESTDNSTYSTIQSYVNMSNSSSTYTLNLNCDSRYVKFIYSNKTSGNVALDNVVISSGSCSSNTITTGTITGSPFSVDCGGSATGSVSYTSSGTFNTGNTFAVQLSNSSGSFSSPTTIGTSTALTAAATNPSGAINFSIPAGTVSGTGYRLRIIASSPSVTSDTSATFAVNYTPCSITTGTVSTSPFAVDCSTGSSGTVAFTSVGTYASGNVYTAQLSNASGSFSSPVNIGTLSSSANSGTINITIPAGTASGTGYLIRVISSSNSIVGSSSVAITVNYTPCSITTGTVSTSPFAVDCSTGSTGTVTFTSVGTYASGNSYTAQLSNASGSFSSPVNVGTLSSSANSGTINITIPAGTASGTGYLIRVISSSNSIVGSSSVAITIMLSGGPCVLEPPHVTSIIYDGCNATGCDEGQSEIVFGNTGDYSLNVSSSTIEINYPGSPLYNLTGTIINNTSTTSAINTAANCSGLFVDGYNQTLPPNSAFLIVPSAICLDVLTWSDLCGTGPIYIIYGQSGTSGNTWHTGGNFANTGGARTFEVVFTTTDATVHTVNYTYTAPGSGANGNYATWTSIGGNAVTQGNFPNCHLTPVVLPTGLSYFKGYNDEQQNVLVWETESEQNNSHFTVFHSVDGFEYELMATVSGAGNSSEKLDYQLIDEQPRPGVNYYKLFSTDFDGTTYYKGIVVVEVDLNTVYYNQFTKSVELPDKENVEIYSPEGKLMTVSSDTNSIPFNHSGVFLVRFLSTGKTVRIFIP